MCEIYMYCETIMFKFFYKVCLLSECMEFYRDFDIEVVVCVCICIKYFVVRFCSIKLLDLYIESDSDMGIFKFISGGLLKIPKSNDVK